MKLQIMLVALDCSITRLVRSKIWEWMNYSKTSLKSFPKNLQIKSKILLTRKRRNSKRVIHNRGGVAEMGFSEKGEGYTRIKWFTCKLAQNY